MRRRILTVLLFVLATLSAVVGWAWWASKQVPEFYAEAMASELPPAERKAAAKQFVQRTLRIREDVEFSDRWAEEFEQDQINGWLAEELPEQLPELLPEGVEQPRVALQQGIVSLGFHFTSEAWSGVVSVRVRPRMAAPNRLSIEVVSIRAGHVPVPLDELMREIVSEFETDELRVRWLQGDGHDVALVTLSDDPDAPVLEHVEVGDGTLRLSGRGMGQGASDVGALRVSQATAADAQVDR